MTANWTLVLAGGFAMILSLVATTFSVVSRLRHRDRVVPAHGDADERKLADYDVSIVELPDKADPASPDQGEHADDLEDFDQLVLPGIETDSSIVPTESGTPPIPPRHHRGAGDLDDTVGYRATAAIQIAGITYRQLDYWSRQALVTPSMVGLEGERLYTFKDLLLLKIVNRLLQTGISISNIRLAVDHLRQRPLGDLSNITLFSDGKSVYEATSAEEVVDLLTGGKGVFGIAVNGSMLELSSDVAEVPGERLDGAESTPSNVILIAHRRSQARKIG